MEQEQRLRPRSTVSSPENPASARFVIDGQEHPELFLPSELMAALLNTRDADPVATHRLRSKYEPWLVQFGWNPGAFWHDFDMSSLGFQRLNDQASTPVREKEFSRRMCAERHSVMNAMRRNYSRFDEFLYVAVAPFLSIASDHDRPADWLAWVESGCK